MRSHSFVALAVACLLLALLAAGLVAPAAVADSPPRLFWTLRATTVNGLQRFTPLDADGNTRILVPVVGTVLNITIVFDDTMEHTFTIRSTASNAPSPNLVDIDFPASTPKGTERSVTLTVWGSAQAQIGSRNETTQTDGNGIVFVCRPHESLGMKGTILIGGVQQQTQTPQMGVFLRAYWIGLLGIAGTLLLVAISYFVIKSSSRHYTDHREHIRRGGP